MYKKAQILFSKSLYAIMLAPAQPEQSFYQWFNSIFYPGQSRYGRLASLVNTLDRIFPGTSRNISSTIAQKNLFPWQSPHHPVQLIGSGAGAAVFKFGDNVLRIYRKSIGGGIKSAISTVNLYRKYYHTMNTWYKNKHNIVLPMHFLVIHGPPLSQPVAASLQAHIPLSRKDFFKDFTQDQLVNLAQDNPSFKQSLIFFLEQTFAFYDQEGACPDILGTDNIVIVFRDGIPHLHILDTGILYLDNIQAEFPDRIYQIQAAMQSLETLYQVIKDHPKTQVQGCIPTSSIAIPSSANFFNRYIQKHVTQYYPQLDTRTTRVRLAKKEDRLTSRLYYFDITDQHQTKPILVKVSFPESQKRNVSQLTKPRLYPATDPFDMPTFEYQALSKIDSHLRGVDPGNISTIKVLDFIPDKYAIVMEAIQHQNLRTGYLKASSRLYRNPPLSLISAFQNAGRWLSLFHSFPLDDHVQDRHTHPKDFISHITVLADHLIKHTHNTQFLTDFKAHITSLANQYLPQNLPLGLGHGDFAARNILVNRRGTVTVFDTFAKWNAPIYEDIGYFLNNIRSSWYQITTLGFIYPPQYINAYEKAFLSGYFEDTPIPYPQIKLFEILALLDKWADSIERTYSGTRRSFFRPVILALTVFHF